MITWSRPEPFGAWVRLDDATLVAVDEALAARLGVAHGHGLGEVTRPLEVHVAVTARCPAACTGCYLDARPDGEAPPREVLLERLTAARNAGAATVAFGGGEPLTRDDLGELARAARALGLAPVMTTSGIGLTPARARSLGDFAQINVSHDGVDGAYARTRGFSGANHAERAIAMLHEAGIAVGVNLVVTRESFSFVEATAARVAALGARELQLLRYKPAGRAADPTYEARRLSPEQIADLFGLVERLVARAELGVRIDCAMVPLLSSSLVTELEDAEATLEKLGIFGCEAARHLGSLAVTGSLAACSFLSPSLESKGDIGAAWDSDRGLSALRDYHARLPEPCGSCSLRRVCRGGCQAVSSYSNGAFAPDPECPRVVLRTPAIDPSARP